MLYELGSGSKGYAKGLTLNGTLANDHIFRGGTQVTGELHRDCVESLLHSKRKIIRARCIL